MKEEKKTYEFSEEEIEIKKKKLIIDQSPTSLIGMSLYLINPWCLLGR